MRGIRQLLRPSLESDDKTIEHEDERVFYGRMKDVSQLQGASSMEQQEQYEVKVEKSEHNLIGGRMRVRKAVAKGSTEPTFTFTIKTASPKGGDNETNAPSTEQMFTQFKGMCEAGMMKDRYTFKVGDSDALKWEVDVYPGPNGQYQPWVRIELEVQDFQGEIPELPIDLEEAIVAPAEQQTPEEKAKIKTLFETVFLRPNPYLGLKGVENPDIEDNEPRPDPQSSTEPEPDSNKDDDEGDDKDKGENKPDDDGEGEDKSE